MAEHTEGPWAVNLGPTWVSVDDPNGTLAQLEYGDGLTREEAEANAHLIAAAPDMLDALQECLREHGGFTIKGECERRALAAIAKATATPKGRTRDSDNG